MDTEEATHFHTGKVNFDLLVDGCTIAPPGRAVIMVMATLRGGRGGFSQTSGIHI